MLTADGPKVIEFNVRFGDPEAQVILPMIEDDLSGLLMSAAAGELEAAPSSLSPQPRVGVVLASGGYPDTYDTGKVIHGLDAAEALPDVNVFHSGTAKRGDDIVTAGGRVLTVVASGADYRQRNRSRVRGGWPHQLRRDALSQGHRSQSSHARQRTMTPLQVLILMGSQNDAPVMQGAVDVLKELGISVEMTVASAHRSPERVMRLLDEANTRGVSVFIVGAGAAAHLGGVVAAHVTKPVIGVPIDSSALNGLDALFSTVQMPPGVPVATVSIGKAGRVNAGVLAAQILALGDKQIAKRLEKYKTRSCGEGGRGGQEARPPNPNP